MRPSFGPPALSVEDVWDNSLGISIEQPPMGLHGRPQRWAISVFDGKRLIQSFQVPVLSLVEHVRIDHGLEHSSEVTVSVRGVSDEGSGRESTVTQRLLPPPCLRQEQILPDSLHLHWYFPDWQSPFDKLVSRFEIGLTSDAVNGETLQEFVCSYDSEADCLQGNAIVHLAPHMLREASNFAMYGRVRCYSSRGGVWGQWSSRVRLLCLSPLRVELRNITSQSMVFVWGRNASEAATAHPNIQDVDVAVERMEVVAWPARHKREPRFIADGTNSISVIDDGSGCASDRIPPRSVSLGQARIYGPNLALLEGLLPNTVYNVCCRWRQMCGGSWHREYFRVATRAEPEIVAVPTIGRTFVDIHWAPRGGVEIGRTADLTEYIDDTFEAGADASPAYRIDGVVKSNTSPKESHSDLHRITVSEGSRQIFSVDASHNPRQRVQSYRVQGIAPGATVRLSVKTASHFEVDGIDHWSWGKPSQVIVVSTVSDLRVVPQERGPNFIVLRLQCDDCEPVRLLRKDALFADEDTTMLPKFITPRSGVYGFEPLGEGDIGVSEFPDDGELDWGTPEWRARQKSSSVSKGPEDSFGFVRLDAPSQIQLVDLRPNCSYRFSINVKDKEGRYWGRMSSVFVTSPEDLLTVRPYVLEGPEQSLRVDQNYHDAALRSVCDLSVRYPVVVGEQRRKELSVTTALLPSRLTSIALKAHVSALGSDHCVLNWEAFALVDGSRGEASVLHHAEVAEQQAKAFNSAPYGLYEYRLKAFVCMAESARLQSQRERGVAETSKEIYFRSAVRTAKLLGLEEGYRYRITLSYFNVVSQKWSPWCEPICLMPADRLVTLTTRIAGTGVSFKWRRQAVPPIDRDPSQTIAPKRYEVRVQRYGSASNRCAAESDATNAQLGCGSESTHFVNQPEFTVTDLPTGTLAVSARPWFDDESSGPYAAPCYISVAPLRLATEGITQSTARLWWDLPQVVPAKGAKGRIVLNLVNNNTAARTVIDLGPFDTRYTLKNLAPSTPYTLSGLQLVEAASAADAHVYAEIDPSHFHTLGPLSVNVSEIGEDYVVLCWPRRSLLDVDVFSGGSLEETEACVGGGGRREKEKVHTSMAESISSPLRVLASPSSYSNEEDVRADAAAEHQTIAAADAETSTSSAAFLPNHTRLSTSTAPTNTSSKLKDRTASLSERYELVVEDVDFGHDMRIIVPCSRSAFAKAFYKVTGLMPGGAYRAKVRIDSEAAFFSDEISFRTADPLSISFSILEDDLTSAVITIAHPLRPPPSSSPSEPLPHTSCANVQANYSAGSDAAAVQTVAVRVETEVKVEEVPRAPTRHLTGSRAAAALMKVRRTFVRRFVLPPTTNVATVKGLPPKGTVLRISARQQASSGGGEEWLPWVCNQVTV